MRARVLGVAFTACAAVAACAHSTSSALGDGGVSCTPGATVACECPGGGSSFKTCDPDGAGYGTCSCTDAAVPDDSGMNCMLGTVLYCGACNVACPGMDNAGTTRVCTDSSSQGKCDLVCNGEYYDLNGVLDDGCEAEDPVVQDTSANAIAVILPNTVDPMMKSNPLNIAEYVYGDTRQHAEPPTARPLGRPDWWKVAAEGDGDPSVVMTACLGITNFPSDDQFEVCLSDIGTDTFSQPGCATVMGGAASVCVNSPAKTDAGDPYYVRVRKLAGSNTANGYALYLTH